MDLETLQSYVSSWEKSGRNNFTTNLKSLLSNNDFSVVLKHLQSLANYVLLTQDSPLGVEGFVAVLDDLLKCLESSTVLEIKIADLLWCCESLLHLPAPHVSERFHLLIAQCRSLVSDGLLKERLSEEVLESCQLIPTTRQLFQSRYVKTKTRLFYKQHKFNLLREEGEGYAKLATELAQFEPSERDGDEAIDQSLRLIKSLIGCFDLDPNRVLDLILDVCECRVEHIDFFLQLITKYATDRTDLCHSVGHKFHFYEQEGSTPKNLHIMTARFLQAGLIDLKTLYPHLTPTDSKNAKLYDTASEIELKKRKKNNFTLDLPPLPESLPQINDFKSNNVENDINETDHINSESILSYEELFGNHQKLGLCEALVTLGDWDTARTLLDRFVDPSFPTSYPPLRKALCSLLHWMIDIVYSHCNPLPVDLIKSRIIPIRNYSNLRQPEDITELVRRTFPIAYVLGPNLHHDQRLLVKFVRISQAYLAQANVQNAEKADPIYQGIFNLVDFVLLPSLSMIEANCVLAEEIWQILQYMPYDHRYRLFSQWKNVKTTASLMAKRNECLNRTKYIIKRLTKDNIKLMGRQLGKLCHSNPCIVFDYILNSIQRYDNLIGPVVEACKYMSSLSYDVFMYCVIEQLATSERQKFEDLQLSLWFQHICNITGQMCKRYQCDLTGIIQFVLNQLKMGSSYDLLLFRELMHKMTGIEVTEEVTCEQLEAMMGGELLRQEGSYYSQIRNTRKNSQRIKQVLLENDLALPCIFLMARHREGLVFREGVEMHLKLCGKLHDQCQDTLVQFGSFLGLNGDELSCPSLGELVSTYHVPVDVSFFILRSTYRNRINKVFEEKRNQIVSSHNSSDANSSAQEEIMKLYVNACRAVASEAVEQIKPLHAPKVWEELTTHFYVLFWSLQASDLACPKIAYERQISVLKQQALGIDRDKILSESKRKKEKERLKLLEDRLLQEQKLLTDHVARVMYRLKQEKDTWFQLRTKTDTITQFLQLCVYPRIAFTTCDALFAAKFIHVLHTLKTPNFSTLICFDRIFNDITLPMTTCTENEAHRYGRFLAAILDLIMSWHSSPEIYNPECSTFPGFVTVFRKGTDSNTKADQLEFENYRHVVHKWHYRITKATVACLESSAYVQIRNTLIVLIRILDHYPRITSFGQAVERRLEKLIEEEKDKRKDLHALAVSYHGKLRLRRPTWVPDYDFHIKDECTAAASSAPSSAGGAIAGAVNNSTMKRKVAPAPASTVATNGERPVKATKLSPASCAAKSAPSSSNATPSRSAPAASGGSSGPGNSAAKAASDRVANTSGGTVAKRNVPSVESKAVLNNTSPSSSSAAKQEASSHKASVVASSASPNRRPTSGTFPEGSSAPEMKRRKIEAGAQSSQSRGPHVKQEPSSGSTSTSKRVSAPNGRSAVSPKDSGESSRSRLAEVRPSQAELEADPRRLFKAPASASGSGGGGGTNLERRMVIMAEGRASSAHHHASGGNAGGSSVSRASVDPSGVSRGGSGGNGGRSGDDDEAESSTPGSGRRAARSMKVRKEAPSSSMLASHSGEKRVKEKESGAGGGHLPSSSGGSSSAAWSAKHHSRSRSNPRK